jgi:hypothetical protein
LFGGRSQGIQECPRGEVPLDYDTTRSVEIGFEIQLDSLSIDPSDLFVTFLLEIVGKVVIEGERVTFLVRLQNLFDFLPQLLDDRVEVRLYDVTGNRILG